MVAALVVSTLVLALAFRLGMRYNLRLADFVLGELEKCFQPQTVEYTPMGQGVAYGFEYQLPGPIPAMRGVFTTLPRYAPLYVPIARLLGRNDLLKLTFQCDATVPAGVGTLVHETARRSRWHAVERDDDWTVEEFSVAAQRFRLFSFNPLVGQRMRELVPRIAAVTGLNQISLDSRRGTITVFLTPNSNSLRKELNIVADALLFLTAPETRFNVN